MESARGPLRSRRRRARRTAGHGRRGHAARPARRHRAAPRGRRRAAAIRSAGLASASAGARRQAALRRRRRPDAAWAALCASAQVALVSASPPASTPATAAPLTVVVTAFGADAPDAAASELAVQARSGAMATTGPAAGAPCVVRAPLLELLAGLNAATSVLAALRAGHRAACSISRCSTARWRSPAPSIRRRSPIPRCAFATVRGTRCARRGTVYRTSDGWVTICIASDDQWRKFATAIGRADLAGRRGTRRRRRSALAAIADVDAAVTQWTQARPVADVVRRAARRGPARVGRPHAGARARDGRARGHLRRWRRDHRARPARVAVADAVAAGGAHRRDAAAAGASARHRVRRSRAPAAARRRCAACA